MIPYIDQLLMRCLFLRWSFTFRLELGWLLTAWKRLCCGGCSWFRKGLALGSAVWLKMLGCWVLWVKGLGAIESTGALKNREGCSN